MHVSFCKDLILTRVLGLPQSIEIDQRPDEIQARLYGAPAAAEGGENKQLPLLAR